MFVMDEKVHISGKWRSKEKAMGELRILWPARSESTTGEVRNC
jgi:hypothetical protein